MIPEHLQNANSTPKDVWNNEGDALGYPALHLRCDKVERRMFGASMDFTQRSAITRWPIRYSLDILEEGTRH